MNPRAFLLERVEVLRSGKRVLAVEQLGLSRGETTAVVGPSGAGKSTLLRLLAGLEPPSTGQVSAVGVEGEALSPGNIVMVFQRPALLRGTVAENAAVGLKLRGVKDPVPLALPWLKRLGLADTARQRVESLSGGEYQRVALARALVLKPEALLLDEPTSNLDPENVALIERLVREAQEEWGMTVVWVTHNPAQAGRVARSVVLLMDGRVVEHSGRDTFFGEGATAQTRDFLGGRTVW